MRTFLVNNGGVSLLGATEAASGFWMDASGVSILVVDGVFKTVAGVKAANTREPSFVTDEVEFRSLLKDITRPALTQYV